MAAYFQKTKLITFLTITIILLIVACSPVASTIATATEEVSDIYHLGIIIETPQREANGVYFKIFNMGKDGAEVLGVLYIVANDNCRFLLKQDGRLIEVDPYALAVGQKVEVMLTEILEQEQGYADQVVILSTGAVERNEPLSIQLSPPLLASIQSFEELGTIPDLSPKITLIVEEPGPLRGEKVSWHLGKEALIWLKTNDSYQLISVNDLSIGQTVVVLPQKKWIWKSILPENDIIQELIIIR